MRLGIYLGVDATTFVPFTCPDLKHANTIFLITLQMGVKVPPPRDPTPQGCSPAPVGHNVTAAQCHSHWLCRLLLLLLLLLLLPLLLLPSSMILAFPFHPGHCGVLPRLVVNGLEARLWCTQPLSYRMDSRENGLGSQHHPRLLGVGGCYYCCRNTLALTPVNT